MSLTRIIDITNILGTSFRATAQFTRPNDTTQYAIGDVIADSTGAPTILTFADVGSVVEQDIGLTSVTINMSTAAAVAPQFRLNLFSTSVTPVNDNAAFALSDADSLDRLCAIAVIDSNPATNNNMIQRFDGWFNLRLDAADVNLYGILQLLNAYTPAAQEIITVTIAGVRLTVDD